MRALLTRLHRVVGLALALFLIIAGLTGAPLAFYRELDGALNPQLFHVEPAGRAPLPVDALIARVEAQLPGVRVAFAPLDLEPGESAVLGVEAMAGTVAPAYDEVFADPYDGRVLGTRLWGAPRLDAAHLMPFVYKLHYTLHLPGEWGTWLLGIVSLAWLLDCFVGAALTFPRGGMSRVGWFRRWRPAWGVKRARVNYDAHRASGLWLWGVLAVLAFTGVYFNLNEQVFKPVVSLFSPLTPYPQDTLPRIDPASRPRLGWDAAVDRARTLLPAGAVNFEPWYVQSMPDHGVYRVAFQVPGSGERALAVGRESVFVDAATGALRARHGGVSGTAGDVFADWQYPLHSGQAFGLFGRILVCLAGLVTALLSVTGIVIWARKRRARRPGRAGRAAVVASNAMA